MAIRGLALGYGPRVVLEDVWLEVPPVGVLGIMGPGGVGKTSLLRVLAGVANSSPAFWTRGEIVRAPWCRGTGGSGAGIGAGFLAQKDRLYTGTVLENLLPGASGAARQQRDGAHALLDQLGLDAELGGQLDVPVLALPLSTHKKLLIARMLAGPIAALFVDEPLSDVAVADEDGLIEVLARCARQRAVVVVLHNKLHARRLCDRIALFSGGRLVETAPTHRFFSAPRSAGARAFLESGSGWPPAPDQERSTVLPRSLPWASAPILREFHWVQGQVLAGAQRPGLLGDDAEDLRALQALGIRHVVSLTEEPYDSARLAAMGMGATHFPIVDMGVPTPAAVAQLCGQLAPDLQAGRPTLVHCRAGLGRTGTVLACILVHGGLEAGQAVQAVRRTNPRYIQTEEQFRFIGEFEAWLRDPGRSPSPAPSAEHRRESHA